MLKFQLEPALVILACLLTVNAPVSAADDAMATYVKTVREKLEHGWVPAAAPKAHATITFRVAKDGRVHWLEISDASGNAAVNNAAEDAVASIAPLTALPGGTDHIDIAASFDSNVENSSQHRYSRPSPERVKEAKRLVTDANVSFAAKHYLAAVDNIQKAIEATPFDVRIRDRALTIYVAAAESSKEDKEYAAELLHQALLLDPTSELARRKLNEFLKADGKDPLDAGVRLNLAKQFKSEGRVLDALAEYGESWRIKNDTTLIPEINAVCKMQESYRTLEKWKAVVDRSRTPESLVALGQAYERCGDVSRAQDYYRAALGLDANYEPARTAVSNLAQKQTATASDTASTEPLSDIFPYANSATRSVNVSLVKDRQVALDYMRWACTDNSVKRWTPGRFPLRLYVESGYGVPGWRPQFNKMVADGLAAWCAASENRITFVQVPSLRGANITCKWTNKPEAIPIANAQGYCHFEYMQWQTPKGGTANETISKGAITILTINRNDKSQLSDQVMKSVCIHEVGHALGLAGHSPYPGDIMYPSIGPWAVPTVLTAKDKNTLKHLYQGYKHNTAK